MTEDLKIDDLNPCGDVEHKCLPEDSKPRARQKQEDKTGTDEWPGEEVGLAGDPLAVSPDATPESLREGVDEADRRQLQVVEPHVSGPEFDRLLIGQLAMTVRDANPDAVDGAVQLYQSFKPADATESVLARIAVGLTNATMDGLEQAMRLGQTPEARQMELRLSHKGASTVIDVLTFLQRHRGLDPQQVSVGSVNVGSGGQAIVGTVQSAPTREPAVIEQEAALTPIRKDEEEA